MNLQEFSRHNNKHKQYFDHEQTTSCNADTHDYQRLRHSEDVQHQLCPESRDFHTERYSSDDSRFVRLSERESYEEVRLEQHRLTTFANSAHISGSNNNQMNNKLYRQNTQQYAYNQHSNIRDNHRELNDHSNNFHNYEPDCDYDDSLTNDQRFVTRQYMVNQKRLYIAQNQNKRLSSNVY